LHRKLLIAMQLTELLNEPHFTPEELAKPRKLHPATIRKLFLHEEGVILLGHPSRSGKRQYFTLRIPASVAQRVFARMTVTGRAA
jgi:hypothetical protein